MCGEKEKEKELETKPKYFFSVIVNSNRKKSHFLFDASLVCLLLDRKKGFACERNPLIEMSHRNAIMD